MPKKTSAIFLFAFLVAIDQLSKFIIRHSGGFYICNSGVAFGIKIPIILIYALCLIFILLIWKFIWLRQTWRSQGNFAIILIASGSISNLIDRFRFGCVVDFIDLHFWPIFNLADVFICLGAIILVAKLFKK
jgi:signal peptidase II